MTHDYYDELAPFYKFIYPDWEASVQRQAKALDSVIREYVGPEAKTVLDAACGIGTQSIGLAKLGYRVSASDLSPAEIEAAKREARAHGVEIDFRVADMRYLWDVFHRQFDLVIACDNSVPHLLDNDQLLQAFREFYRCTLPGGGCLISVRDYAALEKPAGQKKLYPRSVHRTENGQVVMFDVWDFEGDCYEITTYIVQDTGEAEARTQVMRGGRYYCVEIPTLERLLQQAGFQQVVTLRERFFQPLLIAKK